MNQATVIESQLDPRELALQARVVAARAYLVRWRPLIVTVLFTATLALSVAFPDDARAGVVTTIALFLATSLVAAAAVILGAAPLPMAFGLTLLDVPLVAAWAIATDSSTGESMSALGITVLVAAWLHGPRVAAFIGSLATAAILGVWFGHERWATDQVLPDVVWVVNTCSVLAVVISLDRDRALRDVGHGARRAVAAMRDVVQLRRRLVADVSHALRTPLTSINGFLDTVLAGDVDLDDETTRTLLVEARRGGERLERLIGELLVVERAYAGVLDLDVTSVRAEELVDGATRAFPIPPRRRLRVSWWDEDARSSLVLVDEDRSSEILANLLSNAIRHGRGDVEFSCCLIGPMLRIDVSDTGDGLPAHAEEHAFEPFATFGEHVGFAGLGLAVSRAYALAQGGTLEYVADDGTGTHAFRLQLPVTRGS